MPRKLLIDIHLYLAAFFTPFIIIVSVSGGLDAAGIGMDTKETLVQTIENTQLNLDADDMMAEVKAVLVKAGIDHRFEQVRVRGNNASTRPSSRTHYTLSNNNGSLEITERNPSILRTFMELHKGHGPKLFKTFEIAFGLALFFIAVSGLWLGLANRGLRKKTLVITGAGLVVFLVLALL